MSNIQQLEAALVALENSTNKEIVILAGVVKEVLALIQRAENPFAPAPTDPSPSEPTAA
jgi:hypothetical protein